MKDVARLGRERQETGLVGRPARLVIAGMEFDLLGALANAIPCVQARVVVRPVVDGRGRIDDRSRGLAKSV